MKKSYQSQKHRARNRRHSERQLRNKLRWRNYRKELNRRKAGEKNRANLHPNHLADKYRLYDEIVAPSVFSFIQNTEEMNKFIATLERCFQKKRKTFVRLRDVRIISYDAIVILLSIMIKFKGHRIDFDGDFPLNPVAKKILDESGFVKYLFKPFSLKSRYELASTQNSIHTHALKTVDAVLTARIIAEASRTIWGTEKRCQGVQRVLLELMQNTHNHATLGSEGQKHWWLSVNHLKEKRKVIFSFVDYGIGVFQNLANKPAHSKFHNWQTTFTKFFKFNNDSELLKLILEGHLHRTVTQKSYRGKGLPGIYEVLHRKQISRLHIITNTVSADVEKQNYKNLSSNFNGMFVYWELNDRNWKNYGQA